ncbi:MAG: hypothetical protein RR657_07650 [Peptostreptococcaceae bacterium]
MNEIYVPNLFRSGHYRSSENVDSIIPYIQNYSMNSDNELLLFMNLRKNIIIENIMLFDKVYVDLIDLPIILDSLYNSDKDILTPLYKKI